MAEVKMSHVELKKFMCDVFQAAGLTPEDAEVSSDVLITADLLGFDTHGINRLKPIYIDRINKGILNAKSQVEIVRDRAAIAVVDGHNSIGFVVAKKCMEMAIEKAKKFGIGMVVARNSTHFGSCSYYGRMALNAGCIGQVGCNARPSVCPTFGTENMLGTNPLTFYFPTDDIPFMFDCATSIIQRGKVEKYAREGKPIPQGCVVDTHGNSLTDCKQILELLKSDSAAFLPVGGAGEETAGYKGYGFATVVELLSTCLQQGQYMKQLSGVCADGKTPKPIELGQFFLAMDVEAFCDLDAFKKEAGDILRELRHSRKAEDAERIYTAGEKEYECEKKRSVEGVPLPVPMQKEMSVLRDMYKLSQYKFPWDQ